MSTQEPDFVDESSDEMSDEMSKVYSKIADTAWNSAFAEMIVEKSTSGIRIILDERVKDKLKEGHKFDIGDGRELALDENGELAIVNTGMV
jgi:hypothetical protein